MKEEKSAWIFALSSHGKGMVRAAHYAELEEDEE
jgi:hypothetical protein